MNSEESFGDTLHQWRTNLGITRLDLEKRTGVRAQVIGRIETGYTPNPTWDTCMKLLKGLNLHIHINMRKPEQDQ